VLEYIIEERNLRGGRGHIDVSWRWENGTDLSSSKAWSMPGGCPSLSIGTVFTNLQAQRKR
jgi:hypothetical protein